MKLKDSFGNILPENAFIIRHTEVSEFRNCPRKWILTSHNGFNLEPKETHPALRFGSCWHKALEFHYLGKDRFEGFGQAYKEEEEDLYKFLGAGLYEEDMQEKLQTEQDLGIKLLELYPEWAEEQAEPSDKEFKVVDVEKRLLIPIETPDGKPTNGWLAAKLDTVVDKNDMLYVLEHKTRSKTSSVADNPLLPLDLQMGLQVLSLWAISQQITGKQHNMVGALYNLARKQMPGPRVRTPVFGRQEVVRNIKELMLLKNNLYIDLLEMREYVQNVRTDRYNPQPIGVCRWGCSVKTICEAMVKGENYKDYVDTYFKQRDRDFITVLKEEMDNE